MTSKEREETNKWIKENPFYHKEHKPFNIMLEALEQEPCEDAISRKAVLDMTTAIRTSDYSRIIEVVDIDDVKALPSVKPQTPLNVNELLNKIRAEISAIDLEGRVDAYTLFIRTPEQVKQMALNIIDKYKKESEEV